LPCELVGSPEIVIVDKGEPLTTRLGGSAVASGAHSARCPVTDDPNAGITDRGEHRRCVIGRCLIDDDDFELDVLLA
jgi:hypothetical protein